LTFCFIDPFDISIKFSTVKRLSSYFIDFLILLALHVDANRNVEHYFNSRNSKVDEFLGLPDWRERWRIAEGRGTRFPRFLAEEYSGQMEKLSYLPQPWDRMKHVPECEVRAFGSRVNGAAKNYSDLDLAVVGSGKLSDDTLRRLKEAFEESDLPFRVDVLDWHATSPSFQKVIEEQYEVIPR
jgi:uncharacterized protein